MAVAETEDFSNNATGTFHQLYQLYLSGTEADPAARLAVLDEGLRSSNDVERKVCIDALGHMLDSGHFSRGGGSEQIGSAEKQNVLWGEMEDGLEDTVIPRLKAAKADLKRVHFIADAEKFEPKQLRQIIEAKNIGLAVFSPLNSYLGSVRLIDEISVRKALNPILAAIKDTGCTVVGIAHISKNTERSGIERVQGSVALANFGRSVVLVASDHAEDDGDEVQRKRLAHAKHNVSIQGPDLLYRPMHAGGDPRSQRVKLEWMKAERNVDLSIIFDVNARQPTAGAWLADYLRKNGRTPAKKVWQDGSAAGYSEAALRRAHSRDKRFKSKQTGRYGPHEWWIEEG